MDSMWKKIRQEKGVKVSQIAKEFNVSKQYINKFERGICAIPVRFQIYYLKLRNTDEDKIIINYLEERI